MLEMSVTCESVDARCNPPRSLIRQLFTAPREPVTTGAMDEHDSVQFQDVRQQKHWVRVWNVKQAPTTHLEVTIRAA